MIRARIVAVVAAVALSSGCGYRLVRFELPAAAGGCVHVGRIDGGGAYPHLAHHTEATLRERLAQDLCAPGQAGATLVGTLHPVAQEQPLVGVDPAGAVLLGGTWIATAEIRLVRDGEDVWGPKSVEVERDMLATGDGMLEADALEAHIRLLGERLGEALADLLYGS